MKNKENLRNKKYMAISIIALILIWTVLASLIDNEVKIPSPFSTFNALLLIVRDESFFLQLFNTLLRVVISFSVSFIIAVSLAVLSGIFDPIYYLLKPVLMLQRSIPTMAVILLSLIWLNRYLAPVLVGTLIVFPILYTSVLTSIRAMDKELLEMAYIYKLSLKKKLKYLYIPSIKDAILSISVMSISLCLKVTIAAEVLSQPKISIGTSFQMEKVALNTAGVIAWCIVAVLMASILEYILSLRWLSYFKNQN